MKYIFTFIIILLCSSCTNLFGGKNNFEKRYNKLTNEYNSLLDDEIKEEDRAKVEGDFKEFIDDLSKKSKKDVENMDFYMNESKKKLRYLEDLKD